MKFLNIFLFLWISFALLDPDPDSESGSGSTDLIESGSNPDQHHWNRVGIGLSFRPARQHRLAGRYDNSVPTRFLAPHIVLKFQHWTFKNWSFQCTYNFILYSILQKHILRVSLKVIKDKTLKWYYSCSFCTKYYLHMRKQHNIRKSCSASNDAVQWKAGTFNVTIMCFCSESSPVFTQYCTSCMQYQDTSICLIAWTKKKTQNRIFP